MKHSFFSSQRLLLLLGVTAFAICRNAAVQGFVNVPQVRKSLLQSTSTAVTYEPSHVFIDSFTRNPFLNEQEQESAKEIRKIQKTEESQDPSLSISATEAISTASVATTARTEESSNFLDGTLPNTSTALSGANASWWWWWWWMKRYLQSERARQSMQTSLRVGLHHFLRDSGALRSIMDFLVFCGLPSLALENPEIVPRFLQLTKECTRIPYGSHSIQGIDMFLPAKKTPRGLLFFVHGGAWGSGKPWMYRLLAQPFLDRGMAVAVVGYRTFPCGDIRDQVNDLEAAAKELNRRYPHLCREKSDFGICAAGHSSGAHILMQFLVNRIQRKLAQRDCNDTTADEEEEMRIDTLIGLSAPYEISSHYEFESLRGLEELSPMKAACGNDKERLSEYSPVLQLFQDLSRRSQADQAFVNEHCPRIAMVHGVHDDTVPYSSTRQAAKLLKLAGITKCDELYLSETGHSETVFHLMLGGKTREAVFGWLDKVVTR